MRRSFFCGHADHTRAIREDIFRSRRRAFLCSIGMALLMKKTIKALI